MNTPPKCISLDTSVVGQTFNLSPSQVLLQFAKLLKEEEEEINEDQLFVMMVSNPKKLLGI